MNNRILAALFALAIALFIGVAPVKAEAACNHVDKNEDCRCDYCGEEYHTATYAFDAFKHTATCKYCGKELGTTLHADINLTYVPTADGTQHTVRCDICGWEATEAHNAVAVGDECKCEDCGIVLEHQLVWKFGENKHWQVCSICGYTTDKVAHTPTYTSNGDGTHKVVYVCGKPNEIAATCTDSPTDDDCLCDYCGGPVSVENHNASNLKLVNAVKATCTQDGVEKHYECRVCGALFWDETGTNPATVEKVTRPATGHTESTGWSGDANSHWKECTTCGEKLTEVTAHDMEWIDAGTGHYQQCKVCGWQTPSAATPVAHTWVYTSNGNGSHKRSCSVCGAVEKYFELCSDTNRDNDCVCDYCGGEVSHDGTTLMQVAVYKAPTCTEDGNWTYSKCTICGALFKGSWEKENLDLTKTITLEETVIPATGHQAGVVLRSDEQSHWYVCKNKIDGVMCGEKISVEAHNPEMVYNETVHRLQCTECKRYLTDEEDHEWVCTYNGDGTHKAVCADCGYVNGLANDCYDTNDDCLCDLCGGTIKHEKTDLVVVKAKPATCTLSGYEAHYQCPNCKKLFVEKKGSFVEITIQDVTTEPLGHDWEYAGPTTSSALPHQMKCTRCKIYTAMGHYSEDGDCFCDVDGCNVPVHSHDLVYVPKVEPTCETPGTEAYMKYAGCGQMFTLSNISISAPVTIPALGHDYTGAWVAVEGGHTKTCANCGLALATEAHTDANNDNRCDVCKAELTLEYVPQLDATCTTVGYKEYWLSKATGRKYADANGSAYIATVEQIPALGHEWSQWEDNGNGAHVRTCVRCGISEQYNHTNSINGCVCDVCYGSILGHEATYHAEVAPTCTKAGTKAYVSCTCGKLYDAETHAVITEPVSIPAIGHKLSSEYVEDVRLGNHYQICVNEGCTYKSYSEHNLVVEDPLKGNYHQAICACGYVTTEVHYDKDGDQKCDECGHDMSGTSVAVEQHDSVTVTTGDKETVDNSQSWWQNWWSNLFSSNAGSGASTSNSAAAQSSTTTYSGTTASGSTTTASGSTTTTSGGSASTGSGTTSSSSGSASSGSTANSGSSTSSSSSTGIINEIIQTLSRLFALLFQS